MKRLIPLVLLGLLGCGLIPTPEPTPVPTPSLTSVPTASIPDAPLGTDKNPLILALGRRQLVAVAIGKGHRL